MGAAVAVSVDGCAIVPSINRKVTDDPQHQTIPRT